MSRVVVFALLSSVLVAVNVPRSAHACGVKLTVKSTKVQKPIQPSSNPTRVLVIGDGGKVGKALTQAGHYVESSSDPNAVKSDDFAVVLVDDPSREARVKERFPNAEVIAMRSSTHATVTLVESTVQRTPTLAKAPRTVVVASGDKQPIEAGPDRSGSSSDGSRTLVETGHDRPPVGGENGSSAASSEPVAVASAREVPEEKAAPAPVVKEEKPAPVKESKAAPVPVKEEKVVEPELIEEDEPEAAEPVAEKPPKREPPTRLAGTVEKPRPRTPVAAPKGTEIRFRYASSALSETSRKRLDRTVRWLKQNESGTVVLEGHTDSSGPSEFNLALSQRRAESAASYLSNRGIARDRIQAIGYGEERPQYSGDEDGKNRRVKIVIKGE